MKNLLLILVILPFIISCNGQEAGPKENTLRSEIPNEIKEVSISTFGGRSTVISVAYIITKDSVHYRKFYHNTTQNITNSYTNTEDDWESLLKAIDRDKFKNIENGKSYQETDGNDTEITITTTKNEKITKINADKDPSWNKIFRQLVQTYFRQNP